ncbi:hypothetical protein [Actinomadura violacea]|uniref:Uncharacterized protein n=1 Tax=Actinomadura violacea TaxID=2819934 RepID=A0ABS3S7G6_9ACTN|nr:hypothetical protein [Actinomadura violacea]MBO2464944.1 hypothetical protein [Actinomadura violacea]
MDADDVPAVQYSTGRMTRTQAETVEKWRKRLQEDRPLPGVERKGEALRLLGLDDRPPASSSDVLAAAVVDLLRAGVEEMEVARYSYRTRVQVKMAGESSRDDLPRFSPVSFYLAGQWAARYEALREAAAVEHYRRYAEVQEEAEQRFPSIEQAQQRVLWFEAELAKRRIPPRFYRVSGGIIARMAIDRWRRRGVDRVIKAAVEYAVDAHEQPHRARSDMQRLREQ